MSLHQQLMDIYTKDGGQVKELYTGHNRIGCGGDYLTTVWKKDYRGSFGWDSLETLHAEILRRGFRAVGDTFSSILASREQPDGSIINYHLTRTKIYT